MKDLWNQTHWISYLIHQKKHRIWDLTNIQSMHLRIECTFMNSGKTHRINSPGYNADNHYSDTKQHPFFG